MLQWGNGASRPMLSGFDRPLGGVGPAIAPTVKKARVYDARTGQMIQNDDPFSAAEISAGAGTFPGGIHIQPGTGSGNPYDRIGNAKDEDGNVIMAPNAANSDPFMGMIPDFLSWSKSGRTSAIPPNETSDQAYQRIFGRAKGGDVDKVQPYIINEKGTEAFQPKGGSPVPIPGGKQLFIPSQDGKIIPHAETMKLFMPIGGQPVPIPKIPENNPELLPAKPMYRGGAVHGYPGYGYRGGPLQSYGSGGRGGIDELVTLVHQLLQQRGGGASDPLSVAHSIAERHVHPYGGSAPQTAPAASTSAPGSLPKNLLPEGAAGLLPDTPENFEPVTFDQFNAIPRFAAYGAAPTPVVPSGPSPSTLAMINDPNRPYTENLPLDDAERVNRIYRDMGLRQTALHNQGMAAGRQAAADTYAQQADYDAFTHPAAPAGYATSPVIGQDGSSGAIASGPYGSGSVGQAPAGAPVHGTFGPSGDFGNFQDWIASQRKALRTKPAVAVDPFANDPRVAAAAIPPPPLRR